MQQIPERFSGCGPNWEQSTRWNQRKRLFLLKKPSFLGLAWCLLGMGIRGNLLVQVRLEGSIDTIG